MKTIQYDIYNGEWGTPDGFAKYDAEVLLRKDEIKTGNALVVHHVRRLIALDELPLPVMLVDIPTGKTYTFNEYGNIPHDQMPWPESVWLGSDVAHDILSVGVKKSKAKRTI